MGKYQNTQKVALSVFDSAEWQATGINALPTDVPKPSDWKEFIRVSIVPGSSKLPKTVSGIVQITIFYESGDGIDRYMAIGDVLDEFLETKTFKSVEGSVQFLYSSLGSPRQDPADANISMVSYSIPFTFYGV